MYQDYDNSDMRKKGSADDNQHDSSNIRFSTQVGILFGFDHLIGYESGIMTILAFFFGVGNRQRNNLLE